jgi:hypothetical protein
VIDSLDNYCRKCGKGQDAHIPWQYSHWGLALLTIAIGPFSLVYVWRSPVISRNARMAYTGFILLLTWFLVSSFLRLWNFYQAMLGGAQVY